ncbi:response regulator [Streptomyces sp. NPDC058662]|uniref:response regulator n=1 Tax=Streptomyces sp. NPDC058662 TaxID=3346583 RepID=UPI00366183F7
MPSPPQAPPATAPALAAARITILLVEDHDMVAEAIRLALDRSDDLDVVGRSLSVKDALTDAARLRPDVVVLDRRLPDGDGIAAITRLKAAAPGTRVLVLTGEGTPALAARVAGAGGSGLILKAGNLAELRNGVRLVAAGEVAFREGQPDAGGGLIGAGLPGAGEGSPEAAPGATSDRAAGRAADRGTDTDTGTGRGTDTDTGRGALTPRERQTLELLGDGLGAAEIGRCLGVALNTARNHIQRVLEKLGARSQLEAVAVARRKGLLR